MYRSVTQNKTEKEMLIDVEFEVLKERSKDFAQLNMTDLRGISKHTSSIEWGWPTSLVPYYPHDTEISTIFEGILLRLILDPLSVTLRPNER